MRIYTVHEGPGPLAEKGTRFVREGFVWPGFLFTLFWLAGKRLWWPLAGMLAVTIMIGVAQSFGLPPTGALALDMAIAILIGLEGRNWERARLARAGFRECGVVAGATLAEAEARWFARAPRQPAAKVEEVLRVEPVPGPSLLPWPGGTP